MKLRWLPRFFFWLSSVCKSIGKLCGSRTIVVDALTLPGWFIVDECIIYQTPCHHPGLIGFQWDYWTMPDAWIKQMRELTHQGEYKKNN